MHINLDIISRQNPLDNTQREGSFYEDHYARLSARLLEQPDKLKQLRIHANNPYWFGSDISDTETGKRITVQTLERLCNDTQIVTAMPANTACEIAKVLMNFYQETMSSVELKSETEYALGSFLRNSDLCKNLDEDTLNLLCELECSSAPAA